MAPIYQTLGLQLVYCKILCMILNVKKHINADILYATNNELGFDYLRDNMKFRLEDYVQRELNLCHRR